MRTRVLLTVYGGWMLVLTAAFYWFPSWQIAVWAAIGVSSAVAIVAGALINRSRRKAPWILLACAVLTLCAGDTVYNVIADVYQADPFPVADILYFGVYPFMAVGLLLLANGGPAGRDRASLLDALIVTAGLALLAWLFLIQPNIVGERELGERITGIAYPLGDIIAVATVARLVITARRTPAVILLVVGALGLFVADILYGLAILENRWQVGSLVDLGWVAFYGCWGAAALHPTMAALAEPRVVRNGDVSPLRLAMLAASSLVAPAVLLVEALGGITGGNGGVRDAAVVAVFSAVLFLLVIFRLAAVVNNHRQAIARERALRQAGAALAAATDSIGVTKAVRSAVAELLPPGTEHRVVLSVKGEAAGVPLEFGAHVRAIAGWSHEVWPVESAGERASRLLYRRSLDPSVAMHLSYFDVALQCPLAVDDRPSGDPRVGMLFVAAEESALAQLPSAVEVLASQAALALERITLTSEINRRTNEEYFRTLVQNMNEVILILNDDGRIRYASPSADLIFGGALAVGGQLEDVILPEDRHQVDRSLDLMRMGGRDRDPGVDWTVLHADGSQIRVEVSGRDLRRDPTVRGMVITLRDVTERRLLERELMHRAFHDSLTGLANRVLFADRVQQAVTRSERNRAVIGVLFIDLDDFKVVNDTMGHETGDRLLVAVGRRLAANLRPHDSAARLGGDEFAALIDDAVDATEVERVADRITAALAEPFPLGTDLISGAASVGVSTTVEAGSADDLLRQADLALYVAKGAGKGQWRRYQSALHTEVLKRLELRSALDQAVADGEFTLRYQPIVELATGQPAGFEALVRWNHPVRGLVGPGEFITVAEESGLIVPIGGWVLRHALAQAAQWQAALPKATDDDGVPRAKPYVSVNVSVRQFRTAGFADTVRAELSASGLPPSSLLLEITESLLLRDDEQVWADLVALREIGVRVAIDDFGTGYSSLSYLRQVPIDVLKIDRTFIDTMSTSTQQLALVDGIVRLAHTLGLQVVAEGVETATDCELLQEMGCPLGQGFLFSKPLSYGETMQWLLNRSLGA